MTLLAVVVVLVQAGTGAAWWLLVRRHGVLSALELIGVGLALGTFASMLTGVLLVTTPLAPVGWLVPTIVVVPAWIRTWSRDGFADLRIRIARPEVIATVVGLVSGVALVAVNWSRVPLNAPTTDSFADLYFFEALSRGLAAFGPAQSILMSGGSLRYHWFTYAWAGDLAQTAGTAPFVVITRVLPIVTLVGVTSIAAAWAGRLSRVRWVPTLAVLLVVVGGYSGALYGAILNFDSSSQAMTTMWLLAFAVAFLAHIRSERGWMILTAVAALAAACTGGKVSHALVAASGVAVLCTVGLIIRARWRRRALVAGAVSAIAIAVTYLLVLSGVAVDRNLTETIAVKASTWQGLDPSAGRVSVLLGTAALVLAILARVSGLGWLLAMRKARVSPDLLFAVGGLMLGLGAMLALREGVNELWFVLAASAPAAVVSAYGVGRALRRVSREQHEGPLRRPLPWAILVAVPASVVCLILSRNWSAHQALLNWLSPISVWILVPVTALVVARLTHGLGRTLVIVGGLSVAALALTSVATRPAAIWTASRPITTEAGTVHPVSGISETLTTTDTPAPALDAEQAYQLNLDAASWIDANSASDAILVTADPGSALVPALTGRTMYLAGKLYQAGLGRSGELPEVAARALASTAFAAAPSPTTAAPLCAAGADLVWMTGPVPPSAASSVVYRNDLVSVVSLSRLGCA